MSNEACAVMVIDAQNGLVSTVRDGEIVLTRIANVLRKARQRKVPILFIQHDSDEGNLKIGTPGWGLHPCLIRTQDETVIHKRASDAFYATELEDILRAMGIQRLFVCGFKTEMCVDTTSRRATTLGFDVTLITDAHSTTDNDVLSAQQITDHHNHTLDDFGNDAHWIVTASSDDELF
ncbi:cysteine hydrolase family protein [Ferroacidibacillus organovorans]|uniref:Cysteine hydrolase n=1 Tax=Ferroacidibacillus organovorans TaxID=1765683 RepID=A0A162TZJ8_9BACL|nr:cysteine hydrolase family protein [Ferroacidibacillus organovorans]KYP81277.1 hypothetical protein AYJ22_07655 [Ferroacidibacillus organovorans]OAG95326.1 hypothetical protein AYW79_01275 [Ferroacidibacillus organovorans]OPG17130.1 cysteine hydrolase [Ferroacidibacillus organovorans]